MNLRFASKSPASIAVLLMLAAGGAGAQQAAPPPAAAETGKGTFLLTIFLKHDQSKSLDQINAQLRAQGFYKAFPPPGIEVVSRYVMMGIGQVVTLSIGRSSKPPGVAIAPSSTRLTITRRAAWNCMRKGSKCRDFLRGLRGRDTASGSESPTHRPAHLFTNR